MVEGDIPTPAPAPSEVGPADGKWLVDDLGLEYYIVKFAKGREHIDYMWIDENVIRIAGGLPVLIDSQDDEHFYFRYYRPVDEAPVVAPTPPPPPDPPKAATGEARQRFGFEPFAKGLPHSGQWRQGFELADMNGDGHLDLVHGPPRKDTPAPVIYLGDGKGNWSFWKDQRYPRLPFDYGDVAVADFNKDGHLDISLAMHGTGLSVLLGDGKGEFSDWSSGLDRAPAPGLASWSSRALIARDLDGDGWIDLAASAEGLSMMGVAATARTSPSPQVGGITAYTNRGDGSWRLHGASSYLFSDAIAAGDLDGDGRLDLVTGSQSVGAKEILWYQGDDDWTRGALDSLPERGIVEAVEALDLDADGDLDLLIGGMQLIGDDWYSEVTYYLREGESYRPTTIASAKTPDHVLSLATGDLDGDGWLDIVAGTGTAELWIFRGLGDLKFERVENTLTTRLENCGIYAVALRDATGDGRDELFASFAGDTSTVPLLGEVPGCERNGGLYAWTVVGSATAMPAGEPRGPASGAPERP